MKETWREMKKKVVVVELLCYVQLFATPWTVAHQAPLSSTVSWSLLKFILSLWCYLTISSSAILFFCLQSFPASGSSPVNQLFSPGDQSIGASASASVLPVNIQDWFSLGLTNLTSLLSRGLSRYLSSTIQNINSSVLSLLYGPTLIFIHDYWKKS